MRFLKNRFPFVSSSIAVARVRSTRARGETDGRVGDAKRVRDQDSDEEGRERNARGQAEGERRANHRARCSKKKHRSKYMEC